MGADTHTTHMAQSNALNFVGRFSVSVYTPSLSHAATVSTKAPHARDHTHLPQRHACGHISAAQAAAAAVLPTGGGTYPMFCRKVMHHLDVLCFRVALRCTTELAARGKRAGPRRRSEHGMGTGQEPRGQQLHT